MEQATSATPLPQTVKRRRAAQLRVTEIFYSLQGEARAAGAPTVFVRLTGCPLRCQYCDTEYAFSGGQRLELKHILAEVADYGAHHVCVTGGEPLAQPACAELVRRLCDASYEVAVETGGALDIGVIDTRASRVLDIKTPGSGEAARNRWSNLDTLTTNDQIKFVLCDRADFDWACGVLARHRLDEQCLVWFSPSHRQLDPGILADWMLAARVPARLNLQLHKQLWGEAPGR